MITVEHADVQGAVRHEFSGKYILQPRKQQLSR
jgi:hypothetical protein